MVRWPPGASCLLPDSIGKYFDALFLIVRCVEGKAYPKYTVQMWAAKEPVFGVQVDGNTFLHKTIPELLQIYSLGQFQPENRASAVFGPSNRFGHQGSQQPPTSLVVPDIQFLLELFQVLDHSTRDQ